jgi:hypothetical protein
MIEPGTGDRNMLPISYYTQVRTLGYLNSDRYTPEELDTKLRAEGIRTVLVRPELEAAKVLPAQYGYKEIAQVSFCDTKYVVFKVQER